MSKEYTSLGIIDSGDIVNKLSEFLGMEINGDSKDNIFETNFDKLLEKLSEPEGEYEKLETKESITYSSISPYPFMLRDIAVWVPSDVTSDDVLEVVKKESTELLVNTKLFDEFKKDDKISYAFNLVFQSQEKTLSDEEVNKIMDSVTEALNSNSNWEVR